MNTPQAPTPEPEWPFEDRAYEEVRAVLVGYQEACVKLAPQHPQAAHEGQRLARAVQLLDELILSQHTK
jgi:hypothetical protein